MEEELDKQQIRFTSSVPSKYLVQTPSIRHDDAQQEAF